MAIKSNSTGSFYLVAVMLNPTEAERLEGAKKTVALEPTFIIAEDAESAHTAAILKTSREIDPDRCEVHIALPFGK